MFKVIVGINPETKREDIMILVQKDYEWVIVDDHKCAELSKEITGCDLHYNTLSKRGVFWSSYKYNLTFNYGNHMISIDALPLSPSMEASAVMAEFVRRIKLVKAEVNRINTANAKVNRTEATYEN